MDEDYIKAGNIAAKALSYGKTLIKPGARVVDILDKVEEEITLLGGEPAFPVQMSLNDTAAHFCPLSGDETVLEYQVVKLDVGVHINGFVGDNALTVDLSGRYSDLVKASRDALNQAVKTVSVGAAIGEIGKAIEETIRGYGFNPVVNLSGHGLDRYVVHTYPSIPNIDNGDKNTLEEGMAIAIEPFASTGEGYVINKGDAGVFSLGGEKPIRDITTRKMVMQLKKYNGLPFAHRWIAKEFGSRINYAFRNLMQMGILNSYPPLVDRSGGIVSQAEHSIIVKDKPIIITKSD